MLVPVDFSFDGESFTCTYPKHLQSAAMTKRIKEQAEHVLRNSPTYQVEGATGTIQVAVEEQVASFTVKL